MVAVSPYQTALALARPAPNYVVNPVDSERVRAYSTYEDIWNNVPEAFTALLRAGDDPVARRYIPAVRGIIEATNRYLAADMETTWTPEPGITVPDDARAEFLGRVSGLFAREEVLLKLLSMKRWWLIKGDAFLHLSADPAKPEGSRIRLTEVQPENYFPIADPTDGERVLGVYLASVVLNSDDEEIVQRIEYRRILNVEDAAQFAAPIGSVFYRLGFYTLDGWDDRDGEDLAPAEVLPEWAATETSAAAMIGYPLPPQVTSIPVYHFRNNRRGGPVGSFGTSEMQGLESIFAGIIQNTTDEDFAIAMQGIGMYWTDSGRPRDSKGKEVDWEINSGTVIELEKDGKFGRVAGVGSVSPMQDHIRLLAEGAREATAVPDVAIGRVNAQTASSGVALRIEFMPILSKNQEKEQELASKMTHLLFDLVNAWFPAYEGWAPIGLAPGVIFGDPLPTDRVAVMTEILGMVAAKVVSIEWAQTELASRLGYEFPKGMLATITAEQTALMDSLAPRLDAAVAGAPGLPPVDPNAAP